MKIKKTYRIISCILIISIAFCNLPEIVYARGNSNEQVVTDKKDSKEKKTKESYVVNKSEYSTTFEYEDGKKEQVFYGDPVRYQDEDGKYIDYDTSFVVVDSKESSNGESLKGYKYENKSGDKKHYIPEEINEDTPILLENSEYQIALRPVLEDETIQIVEDKVTEDVIKEAETKEQLAKDQYEISSDFLTESIKDVQVESEVVEDLYDNKKEVNNTAVYESKSGNIEYQYVSLENGIKENIILNEKPESNLISYEITTPNATPRVDEETGEIYIYDNDSNSIIAMMESPYMDDATGEAYCDDITYQIVKNEENEDTYFINMVVSKEYLEDDSRVYPVTIDPTVSWCNLDYIKETYCANGSGYRDTNYSGSTIGSIGVGTGTQGICRSFIKFPSLKSTISNKYVESAQLKLWETSLCSSDVVVQARTVTESWALGEVTWNNMPSYDSTVISSFTTTGTQGTDDYLNLTSYAQNIANGTNSDYGIMLRAKDEKGSFGQFYSARNSGYIPRLTLVYYDAPTRATKQTLLKSYIKPGDKLFIYWSGIESVALDYVNYRVAVCDEATDTITDTQYVPYSSLTKVGTTSTGFGFINASANWPEGCYRIYLHGVDKSGVVGEATGNQFYIDGTAPTISSGSISVSTSSTSYSNNARPTIKWSASDAHFSKMEYSVDGGTTYNTMSTSTSGSFKIPEGMLSSTGGYAIKIRAVDKAGNTKEKSLGTYYYDKGAPTLESSSISPMTSTGSYSDESEPTISWTYSENLMEEIQISIDDEEYTAISDSSSDSYTIPSDYFCEDGIYTIRLRAIDSAGNVSDVQTFTYYYDATEPELVDFTINPETDTTLYSSNNQPVITWDYDEIRMDSVSMSINDSEFVQISTAGSDSYSIPSSYFSESGEYTITLRAKDTIGNVIEDEVGSYFFNPVVSSISDYYPMNLKTTGYYANKAKISWDIKEGVGKSSYVKYNVYRGESSDFTPSQDNLVGEKIDTLYWSDNEFTPNSYYYYKVQAVVINSDGEVITSGDYSNVVALGGNETSYVTKRLGIQNYYGYTDITTPNGTGSIEQSWGNFYYTQTDASLPNQDIDYTITRYYNSQANTNSMIGYGWDLSCNLQIYKEKDSDSIWLKDSTGALLEFEKTSNGYQQVGAKDYTLEVNNGDTVTLCSSDKKETTLSYTTVVTDKSNSKYYFDQSGQILCMVSSTDAYLQYNYSDHGFLTSIVSNSGKTVIMTYDESKGVITDITLPDSTVLHYEYSGMTLILASHLSKDGETLVEYQYDYDEEYMLTKIVDAENHEYSVAYKANNHVDKVTYPNGDMYILEAGSGRARNMYKKSSTGSIIYEESMQYDENGYVIESIDALGLTTTNTYENHLLKKQEIDNSYESLLDSKVVFHNYKKTIDYEYNDDDNVTKETDSDGTTTEYTYEDPNNSNLESSMITKDSDGTVLENSTYEYDADGNIEKTTDELANTVEEYTYVANTEKGQTVQSTEKQEGQVVQTSETKTDADGNTVSETTVIGSGADSSENTVIQTSNSNQYDIMGRVLKTVDQKGRVTQYQYDQLGREIVATYTSEGTILTESKTYYPNGQIKSETSKDGTITSYTYDELNRVVTKTIAKGDESKTWTTSYEYGDVTIYTGKDSQTSTVENAYVETEKNPDGEVTSVKYTNGKGQVVRQQEKGIYSDYIYDNSGKAVVNTTIGMDVDDTSEEKVTLTLYNQDGNAIYSINNPVYADGDFKVDEDNSQIQTKTYDSAGNVLTETDAMGYVTSYEYDSSNRVTKVTLPNNASQKYEYDITDTDGNLTTKTINALGAISTEKATTNGNVLAITDQNSKGNSIVTSICYDTEGNKTKTTFADSSYQIYVYDSLQRLVKSECYTKDNILSSFTKYEYDSADQVVAMKDYSYIDDEMKEVHYTGYGYDILGRQTAYYEVDDTCNPTEEQLAASKISYCYDIEGNISSVSYSNNKDVKSLNYSYNSYKWLTKITAKLADDTVKPVRVYSYYNDGKVKEYKDYTDVLGTSESYERKSYEYDSLNRVTKMEYYNGDTKVEGHEYTYDKNSYILSENVSYIYDSLELNETKTYTYDNVGQLLSSIRKKTDGTTVTTSYAYDLVGNRTTMSNNGIVTNYTYNELNQLLSSVTSDTVGTVTSNITYTYDQKGNQISQADSVSGDTIYYTYDVLNQLVVEKKISSDGTTMVQKNKYNGAGQRVEKQENTTTSDSETMSSSVTNYYYQNGVILYTTNDSNEMKTFNYMGQSNNVIGTTRYSDSTTSYYVYNKDIQGSTTNLVNSNCDTVVGYTYDDFGSSTEYATSTTVDNEITYTGAIYDKTTGLYYMNARFYDSENGRFLSQDTYRGELKDENSWHLYTYCANNPINYIDPSGHFAIAISGGVAGVLFAGAAIIDIGYTIYQGIESKKKIESLKKEEEARRKKERTIKKNVAKILEKTKKNKKAFYEISISFGIASIGKKLIESKAINSLKKKKSVITYYRHKARHIAYKAGNDKEPSWEKPHNGGTPATGYYYHYHPAKKHSGAHSFYVENSTDLE